MTWEIEAGIKSRERGEFVRRVLGWLGRRKFTFVGLSIILVFYFIVIGVEIS